MIDELISVAQPAEKTILQDLKNSELHVIQNSAAEKIQKAFREHQEKQSHHRAK